jgi:hypothetical protein
LNGGGILSENKRLVLTCIADAYPSIDSYQWYKNDEKLNISSLASSFIIDKLSKYDSGVYTCLAKNTLKYSNGSTIEKFDKSQTRVTVECKKRINRKERFSNLILSRCTNCSFINTNSCIGSIYIKH